MTKTMLTRRLLFVALVVLALVGAAVASRLFGGAWGKEVYKGLFKQVKHFIKDHWVICSMPFIFFGLTRILFKPYATEEDYNAIHLSFRSFYILRNYINHVLLDPF